MLMTGSFLHRIPFLGWGSTWHPKIIFHRFLLMSCFCLHCYHGQMSLTWVVYVLDVVEPDFCNKTICHRRRFEPLGNFPYPGGQLSSSHPKYLIIVHNQLTWGGTYPETSLWSFNHHPPCRSCIVPHVSWTCIFLAQMLRWMPQTFGSRLWWFHIAVVVGIKFS